MKSARTFPDGRGLNRTTGYEEEEEERQHGC